MTTWAWRDSYSDSKVTTQLPRKGDTRRLISEGEKEKGHICNISSSPKSTMMQGLLIKYCKVNIGVPGVLNRFARQRQELAWSYLVSASCNQPSFPSAAFPTSPDTRRNCILSYFPSKGINFVLGGTFLISPSPAAQQARGACHAQLRAANHQTHSICDKHWNWACSLEGARPVY